MAYFTEQIVVYLDILGFKEKLHDFEKEVITNDDEENENFRKSESLERLLIAFEKSIQGLKESNINYYLFSDCICLTTEYLEDPEVLINILNVIGYMSYQFILEGYFLRGGIDVGWFYSKGSNENDLKLDIAVGIPLAVSYLIESKYANYPRIVFSKSYIDKIQKYTNKTNSNIYTNVYSDSILAMAENYIKIGGENYLNQFGYFYSISEMSDNIISEEQFEYLQNIKNCIIRNSERVNNQKPTDLTYLKYQWIISEFNEFIDELDFKFGNEQIKENLQNLKIITIHNMEFSNVKF